MRVVVDANIFVSALLSSNGSPGKVVSRLVEGGHTFLVSQKTMEELRRILNYPKIQTLLKRSDNEIEKFVSSVELLAEEVDTIFVPEGLECRDPDDLEYLNIAVMGHAECVVSGDKDLLVLERVQDIPVLTAVQLLNRLGEI